MPRINICHEVQLRLSLQGSNPTFYLAVMFDVREVLVKKSYGNHMKRQKRRNWQMERLEREVERDADAMEAEDEVALQEDIEEDPSIRQSVNIYRREGGCRWCNSSHCNDSSLGVDVCINSSSFDVFHSTLILTLSFLSCILTSGLVLQYAQKLVQDFLSV